MKNAKTNEQWVNGKVEETDINYTIDGTNFLYKDEKLILKKGVKLLCKKIKPKSVLEFGFGMGWTATEFQEQGVKRHVILEPNKEIYKMALEWKKQYDDSDIEILNIFSWDFETDEKFDLVYDDIQQFKSNMYEETEEHYNQMDKILENNQWYASMAFPSSTKPIKTPENSLVYPLDKNSYIIQHLMKYIQGQREFR
jgi:spermidine synthase